MLEEGKEEGEKQGNNSTVGHKQGKIQEGTMRKKGVREILREENGSRVSLLPVRGHSSSKKQGKAWGSP